MKLKKLKIVGKHKNFNNLDIDFSDCKGVAAFIGNNGSGKSNILEAFSSIFKSLFLDEKDEFAYFLEYETFNNVSVKITSNGKGRVFAVNGNPVFDIKDYLPKRVIAIYSGEEDRLYKKYYEPVYLNYINGVNQSNVLEYPRMFYLNKFYWNLILLSLLVSEAPDVKDFVENKLGINVINEIKFKFFKDKYKDYNNSPALSFIRRIDNKDKYSLKEFKDKTNGDYNSKDFNPRDFFVGYNSTDVFQALYIAFTPRDKKIIDDVEITFNNGLNVASLSEGQKKMLLIKATLEFASSEDTLILLDEPDAHIHISNKEEVVKVFEPYENNRQIIITTHSPTLTQSFKDENVFMLTNGELIKKDRQYIINELTKDFWNKQQQNNFLGENKDTILVEGKTDITHINTALEKLSSIDDKYKVLDFKFLPVNGASGLKLFVDEFPVNKNTKTFAFLDRDQAGFDAIKETLDFKGTKDEFNGQVKNDIYINYIPKKEGHTKSDFIMEDYYPVEKYKEFLFENVSCTSEMPNYTKSNFKVNFAEKVKTYEVENFEGFRKLFDLILEIKNLNSVVVNLTDTNTSSPQNKDVVAGESSENEGPEITVLDVKAFNHHKKYTSKKTWNNFLKFREELLKLNPEIVIGSNKYFVSLYLQKQNFAVIRFRKNSMNIEVKRSESLVKEYLPNRSVHKNVNGINIGNIFENEDFTDVITMLFEVSKIKKVKV